MALILVAGRWINPEHVTCVYKRPASIQKVWHPVIEFSNGKELLSKGYDRIDEAESFVDAVVSTINRATSRGVNSEQMADALEFLRDRHAVKA